MPVLTCRGPFDVVLAGRLRCDTHLPRAPPFPIKYCRVSLGTWGDPPILSFDYLQPKLYCRKNKNCISAWFPLFPNLCLRPLVVALPMFGPFPLMLLSIGATLMDVFTDPAAISSEGSEGEPGTAPSAYA